MVVVNQPDYSSFQLLTSAILTRCCLKQGLMVCCRRKQNTGPRPRQQFKHYGDVNTLSTHDCNICLVQGIQIVQVDNVKTDFRGEPVDMEFKYKMNQLNYNSVKSFDYEPVLFEDVKYLGSNPMHARICVVNQLGIGSEHKYAQIHLSDLYFNPKTKEKALKTAREHFQTQFKNKLGIKYFMPDPRNGGNSNTGPTIKRILENISVSAEIYDISPVTLYRLKVCCDMINRTFFVNAKVFDRFARAAFNSMIVDLGNFTNISGTTHSLLCHGGLKIRWAQEEIGVALGDLSENSLEMGNKENNAFRSSFSRKCSIIKETWDIFRRRYLISDPKVILEGYGKQELRCGNVRGRQEVKEEEHSSSYIPFSSTTLYCPRTPGGQLATMWRQLEAASWLAGTSRGYRYTVVEESGWQSSELL